MYQAELYSASNGLTVDFASFSLGKYGGLLGDLQDSSSVLEFAMGDGNVTESLLFGRALPAGVAYTGTDISPEMRAFVKRRDAFKDVDVQELDATTVELPERFQGRFDATLALNLFHGLPRIEQALKNIYDTLKPSGITYLVFVGFTPSDYSFSKISERPKWAKYGTDRWCSQFFKNHELIPDYYKKTMAEIGFDEVKCFYDVFKSKYKFAVFKNLMISVNRVIRDVPEEERNDYVEEYLELCFQQDCIQICREGDEDMVLVTLPLYTVYAKK